MVTKLAKTHSIGHVDYVVSHNGETIYDIHLPQPVVKLQIADETFQIKRDDGTLYNMKMNIRNFNNECISEVSNGQGEKMGQAYRRDRKVNFFIGHTFHEFEFMERRFELLLMSVDGIKLLISDLKTGKQVGLAETSGVLHNNLNEWTLYAKNEEDTLITLLATLKMDYRRFMNRGIPSNNVQKIVVGAPKKLRERYQASFKDNLD